MKLETEFFKLPLQIDGEKLKKELKALLAGRWQNDGAGGPFIELVKPGQDPEGRLGTCPYLAQILLALDTVIGRVRLVQFHGEELRCDTDYYWHDRTAIHIPVSTALGAKFRCNGREVAMESGSMWVVDNWRAHGGTGSAGEPIVHLVVATSGTPAFWELMAQAERPFDPRYGLGISPRLMVPSGQVVLPPIERSFRNPGPLPPGEIDRILRALEEEVHTEARNVRVEALRNILWFVRRQWRSRWAVQGPAPEALAHYQAIVRDALEYVARIPGHLILASNGRSVYQVLSGLLHEALDVAEASKGVDAEASITDGWSENAFPKFERPLFIVGAPCSGTELVFRVLARNLKVWTSEGDINDAIDSFVPQQLAGLASDRLTDADATGLDLDQLRKGISKNLFDGEGRPHARNERMSESVRFVDGSSRNGLRIPFLRVLFPDAKFVYLKRDGRENVSAIVDAWVSGEFVTHPHLPGWDGPSWSLLLPVGWQEKNGATIAEIAEFQWRTTNEQIECDLGGIPSHHHYTLHYGSLINDPAGELERLCQFAEVPFGPRMQAMASELMEEQYLPNGNLHTNKELH